MSEKSTFLITHQDATPSEAQTIIDEARKLVSEGENRLARRLEELNSKLPSWDPALDRMRITI